nr:radical SAM protein [Desulfobacterales bacterium]
LPMEKYRAHNWHCFTHIDERQPYASLYTSLGCPFHCHFCCIQAPFKRGEQALGYSPRVNSYRMWNPSSIITQIDILVNEYGVKNIKFADEIFVLNKRHVIGICNQLIERGYDLNIWAYARVDCWTEEMLEKMKRAGINWLCLGIESGSVRVRRDVRKGYRHEDLLKTVEAIRKVGIYIIANYLFGLPEEDMESMQETLKLATELNSEFANFYSAMAYPGSRLYERAMEENLPLPESWTGYSQHAYDTLPLPTRYLSGTEVLRFRDQAFYAYFTNPRYLEMIRQTFGPHIVEHIRKMTSQKLERKYT